MPTLNIGVSVTGLAENINQSVSRTADGGDVRKLTVPKGFAGTLTTRTDDTTGTLTLGDGHGIGTGDKVDIYWPGGRQLNVTVGTVSGDSVPFSGGSGDNLPSAATAVVCSKRVQVNATIDKDNLSVISLVSARVANNDNAMSHIDFQNAGSTSLLGLDLEDKGPYLRDLNGADANPFSGTGPATKFYASNGSSANDAVLTVMWLQDTTP